MELKTFNEKTKSIKEKNSLLQLTLSILTLEETLTEVDNKVELIKHLGTVLKFSFIVVNENKIDINNKDVMDLDLDNWKNNIKRYKMHNQVTKDSYLYTLRNSLKKLIQLLNDDKESSFVKVHIFEIIIKTFLYIDYLNLSIDTILEKQILSLEGKEVVKEIKQKPELRKKEKDEELNTV